MYYNYIDYIAILTLRERVRLKAELSEEDNAIFNSLNIDKVTMRRNKNRSQSPRKDTFVGMKNNLSNVNETFALNFLEDQPYEVHNICDKLAYFLEIEDAYEAEKLFNMLKSKEGFDILINKQFLLSCEAHLYLIKDISTDKVISIIMEALEITSLNHNEFDEAPLFLHEPGLLHSLAKVYIKDNDFDAAKSLINKIKNGINKFSYDNRNKEKNLVLLNLTLAKLQYNLKEYDETILTCNQGFDLSARRGMGTYCPDFLLLKTMAEYGLKNGKEKYYINNLLSAYSGFSALNKTKEADTVICVAKEIFNIELDVCGMDKLLQASKAPKVFLRNSLSVQFPSVGKMILDFSGKSNITRKELYEGITSSSNFTKIESDSQKEPNIYLVESLVERMGFDGRIYYTFFVTGRLFDELELRDRIQDLWIHGKNDEAMALMPELEKSKNYQSGVGLQFVKMIKASVYIGEHGFTIEHLGMVLETIKITRPDFDERAIDKYYLTVNEAKLIFQLALNYKNNDKIRQGNNIFDSLLTNISTKWKDGSLKARLFAQVSFSYSSLLGKIGERDEALNIVNEAIDFELGYSRLLDLPSLLYNGAFNKLKQGYDKMEILSEFLQSYYISLMFNDYGEAKGTKFTAEKIHETYEIDLY